MTTTATPSQAFTPDFYLPAYDLYIEITTLNQKLVTKKNRKARRLVELYPDVQIKVLYQRDYLQLLVKYGLEPPSQLVGAPGDGEAPRPRSRNHAGEAGRPPSRRDGVSHGALHALGRSTPSTARSARAWCPFGGWEMPIQYTGVLEEHRACREHAVVFDVSHLGSVHVHGAGAFAALQWAFTNDLDRIGPGRAQYTHLLDPDDAHVVDDIIVWWIAPGEFLVMPNASNTATAHRGARRGGRRSTVAASARSTTSPPTRAVLAVQGPEARERAGGGSRPTHAGVARFAVEPLEFGGEPGLDRGHRLHRRGRRRAARARSRRVRVLAAPARRRHHAGRARGPRHAAARSGAAAARARARGRASRPLQAGLAWVVRFDKGDFRGRAPLEAEHDRGVTRRLRGLSVDGRQIPRQGYPVTRDGEVVGVVTSGNFSPTLGHGIALAFLPPDTVDGDAVTVDVRGRDGTRRRHEAPVRAPVASAS